MGLLDVVKTGVADLAKSTNKNKIEDIIGHVTDSGALKANWRSRQELSRRIDP